MKIKIKKNMKKYEDIDNTYRYAFVGIPKGLGGLKEPFYGKWDEFKEKYPDFTSDTKVPIVLFMHGSAGLSKGEIYKKYIVEEAGHLFFAPNSFAIDKRPTYQSPTPLKKYERVHKLRQAELQLNLKKLKKLSFIDQDNIFLMGHSEGGLAASIYKSKTFKGRIITAFSCESSYFYENFKLGTRKHEPILNLIGTHDEYFAKHSKFNDNYQVEGHGVFALHKNRNAKVVVLAKTKHDITLNPYTKDEIVNFLKLWSRV